MISEEEVQKLPLVNVMSDICQFGWIFAEFDAVVFGPWWLEFGTAFTNAVEDLRLLVLSSGEVLEADGEGAWWLESDEVLEVIIKRSILVLEMLGGGFTGKGVWVDEVGKHFDIV